MKILYCTILLFLISLCDASGKKIPVPKPFGRSKEIPVKSIKSPDGDIIDCIHIYHQPAFNHPLLKNHTILMKPSYHPEKGFISENDVFDLEVDSQDNKITQLWQLNGRCPDGTIPIRRKPNVRNIERYAKKKPKSIPQVIRSDPINAIVLERAFAYVQSGMYFGTTASINIWAPIVRDNEFSSSQFWVQGGPKSDLNSIEAAWMIFPSLFGDNNTRFTADGYKSTGSFNLYCSGFVQTNTMIALGAAISNVSSENGTEYQLPLYIWKDLKKDVWWLQFGDEEAVIGYWPASIFTSLADGASMVGWGGEVANTALNGQHTTTQMGSGYFPTEQFASFMRGIQLINGSNELIAPDDFNASIDTPYCYNLSIYGNAFFYGGPGRNVYCP